MSSNQILPSCPNHQNTPPIYNGLCLPCCFVQQGHIVCNIRSNDLNLWFEEPRPFIGTEGANFTLSAFIDNLYSHANTCGPNTFVELVHVERENGVVLNNEEALIPRGIYAAIFKSGV